jgi:hypothetical protein
VKNFQALIAETIDLVDLDILSDAPKLAFEMNQKG